MVVIFLAIPSVRGLSRTLDDALGWMPLGAQYYAFRLRRWDLSARSVNRNPIYDAIGLFNTLAYFVLAEVLHTVWETWNDRLVGNAEPARSISARPHPMSRPARLKQERLVDLRARSKIRCSANGRRSRSPMPTGANGRNRLLPHVCATVQKAEDTDSDKCELILQQGGCSAE